MRDGEHHMPLERMSERDMRKSPRTAPRTEAKSEAKSDRPVGRPKKNPAKFLPGEHVLTQDERWERECDGRPADEGGMLEALKREHEDRWIELCLGKTLR